MNWNHRTTKVRLRAEATLRALLERCKIGLAGIIALSTRFGDFSSNLLIVLTVKTDLAL